MQNFKAFKNITVEQKFFKIYVSFQLAKGNLYCTLREFRGKMISGFHQRKPLKENSLESLRSVKIVGSCSHTSLFPIGQECSKGSLFFLLSPKPRMKQTLLASNRKSLLEGGPCLRLNPQSIEEGACHVGRQISLNHLSMLCASTNTWPK